MLLFVLLVVFVDVVLNLLSAILFLLLNHSQVFGWLGRRVGLKSHLDFLHLWYELGPWLSKIEFLNDCCFLFVVLDILLAGDSSFKFFASGVLRYFSYQLIAFFFSFY